MISVNATAESGVPNAEAGSKKGGRIRIVRVIARLNVGGPSIHVINLCSAMKSERFQSILVSGKENPGEGSMWDLALSKKVRPVEIAEIVGQANLGPRDLKALKKTYRLIKREKPHIVHTHTAKAGVIGRLAAWLAGTPIIVHTYHGHVLEGYYGPVKARALRVMDWTLARFTDRLVAVSEEVKSDLVRLGVAAPDKITVIPLGFELDPFLNSSGLRGEFRRELGLDPDAGLVGIVGRLFPIKNHRLFLEAAARTAAGHPRARFVVVGDGVLRNDLEAQSRSLGLADKVIFTGWRRDMPGIYADLDVLVVSSKNEGTPVAAIEAMSSGCPVVATRVGGTPSLIVDGERGFLVKPGDAAALAEAISAVLSGAAPERQRMRLAGREFARKRFSLERLTADMSELYEALAREKGIG